MGNGLKSDMESSKGGLVSKQKFPECTGRGRLCHVDKCVKVRLVPFDVFVFYQPLDLLFDHLFLGQKHVL